MSDIPPRPLSSRKSTGFCFVTGNTQTMTTSNESRPSLGDNVDEHVFDKYSSLEEVRAAMRKAGVDQCGLIFGIDFTMSNMFMGKRTFNKMSLHDTSKEINPYQTVICIMGETLETFDDDGIIPTFGFGDSTVKDKSVFPIKAQGECKGFADVLSAYTESVSHIQLGGPTNFAPLIEKAIEIVKETKQYHILVICADGQVTSEADTVNAIVEASNYPLSITMIGVGDGPWDNMHEYDNNLPPRQFDNFRFTEFHKVMETARNPQTALAASALMEIPQQYNDIKSLKLLEKLSTK